MALGWSESRHAYAPKNGRAPFYYFLGSLGRRTESIASMLLRLAATLLPFGDRLPFVLDDSPTKRAGPQRGDGGRGGRPGPDERKRKALVLAPSQAGGRAPDVAARSPSVCSASRDEPGPGPC